MCRGQGETSPREMGFPPIPAHSQLPLSHTPAHSYRGEGGGDKKGVLTGKGGWEEDVVGVKGVGVEGSPPARRGGGATTHPTWEQGSTAARRQTT